VVVVVAVVAAVAELLRLPVKDNGVRDLLVVEFFRAVAAH